MNEKRYCALCGTEKVNDGLTICYVCANDERMMERSRVFGRYCQYCGAKLTSDEVVYIGDACASCELEKEREE